MLRGSLGAIIFPEGDTGFDGAGGLFAHIGYGPDDGPPLFALCAGLDVGGEFGATTPGRDPLRTVALWGGLALPRAGGILLGVHHYGVGETPAMQPFAYRTLSLRKLFGSQRAYLAFGVEFRIDSEREIEDRLGGGPSARVLLELGVGGGGRGLSR